ncbi:hypothetical protein ACRAWD_16745 [Caulobacter segnis]
MVDPRLAARRISLSFSIADLDEREAARIVADAVGADFIRQANGDILLRPGVSPS